MKEGPQPDTLLKLAHKMKMDASEEKGICFEDENGEENMIEKKEQMPALKNIGMDPQTLETTHTSLKDWGSYWAIVYLYTLDRNGRQVQLSEQPVKSAGEIIFVIDDLDRKHNFIVKINDRHECDIFISVVPLGHHFWSMTINKVPFLLLGNHNSDMKQIPETYRRMAFFRPNSLAGLEKFTNLKEVHVCSLHAGADTAHLSSLSFLSPSLISLSLSECESLQNLETLKNFLNLTELDLSDCRSLKSLDGIKNLSNMEELHLSLCKSLQNVAGLKNLLKLTKLSLNHCNSLNKLEALENLSNLTELDLSGCETLQKLDGLEKCSNLTKLNLSKCTSLEEVEVLESLSNMEDLNLNGCRSLKKVDVLKSLPKLLKLNLGSCESLQNIDGVRKLLKLTKLDLSNFSHLLNVDNLKSLLKLTKLNLSGCRSLQNLDGIKNLSNLSELNLSFCESLQNIEALENLSNLTDLDLYCCYSLGNVDALKNLSNLTKLNLIECTSLENVNALENLSKLIELDLAGCKSLQNVDGLKNLSNFRRIDLSGCESLHNLDGLKNLSNLTSLKLHGCESLQSLEPLENLSNLIELDLSGCGSLQNLDGIKNLSNLKDLNLSFCESLQNLDGVKNLSKISELDLCGCHSLKDIHGLTSLSNLRKLNLNRCRSLQNVDALHKLPNLTMLNLDDCVSIRNFDTLTTCHSLRELSYSNAPHKAVAVLASVAVKRNDIHYIQKNHEDWLSSISTSPELEPLVSRISNAFGLSADGAWVPEAFVELVSTLNEREDCTRETLQMVLREGLKCKDPAFKEIFRHVTPDDASPSHRPWLTGAVLEVLCDIPETAYDWAVDFADRLLESDSAGQQNDREIAPAVCLFYSITGQPHKVRQWLKKVTDPEIPVWRDRVNVSLAKWHLAKQDIDSARAYARDVQTPGERDKIYEHIAVHLGSSVPEEAGEAFVSIMDTVRRSDVALGLKENQTFTASVTNVYRLLLALESDPEAIASLIETLLEQHPDSEIAKELAIQFGTGKKTGLTEAAERFLSDDLITGYVKPKKLDAFKETVGNSPELLLKGLYQGMIFLLHKEGLLDDEEVSEISRHIFTGKGGNDEY